MLFKIFCYGPGLDGFQKAFVAAATTDLTTVLPLIQVPFMSMYAAKDAEFFNKEGVTANHGKLANPR